MRRESESKQKKYMGRKRNDRAMLMADPMLHVAVQSGSSTTTCILDVEMLECIRIPGS